MTIKELQAQGLIGRPLLIESSVCRHSVPSGPLVERIDASAQAPDLGILIMVMVMGWLWPRR